MDEWWRRHKELLVESGLTKKHIDDVVDSGAIQLRDGCDKVFEILKNLPNIFLGFRFVSLKDQNIRYFRVNL